MERSVRTCESGGVPPSDEDNIKWEVLEIQNVMTGLKSKTTRGQAEAVIGGILAKSTGDEGK